MDLDQIKDLRVRLELDILAALQKFEQTTNMVIDSILLHKNEVISIRGTHVIDVIIDVKLP